MFVHGNESAPTTHQSLVMVGCWGKYASSTDPEYEIQMVLAVNDLISGTYKTIVAAARAHKVWQFPWHNDMS